MQIYWSFTIAYVLAMSIDRWSISDGTYLHIMELSEWIKNQRSSPRSRLWAVRYRQECLNLVCCLPVKKMNERRTLEWRPLMLLGLLDDDKMMTYEVKAKRVTLRPMKSTTWSPSRELDNGVSVHVWGARFLVDVKIKQRCQAQISHRTFD